MTGIGFPDGPRAAVPGDAGRGALVRVAVVVLLCAFSVTAVAADNTASALDAAGWSESSPGLLTSLPSRTADIRESGIGGDFVLAPGTALLWERGIRGGSGSVTALEIEMYSEGSNPSSEDYSRNRASFPVSVTAVFGRDSLDLPLKSRLFAIIASLWRGFGRGIRLTYAAGNVAPAGSMYRRSDDETVFLLVGDEDRGKRIAVRRNLAADFRAAYGRDPRGPVTRLVVRAERPSREKGTINAGFRLVLPAN